MTNFRRNPLNEKFSNFLEHRELVIVVAIALAVAGCASGPTDLRVEPRSIAQKLGLPDCKVSVPLSQAEVIDDAKRVGNPNPERNQDWIEITKNFQPGDELRAVNCLSAARSKDVGDPYYYALIRNDVIVLKFHVGFFN
ncbi:hypothetical protein [Dyella mobilis]|uniref:Lipoprotein n=1 Tax=Dyella mobilis TaxID=1849582 RepID=A0ABS2KMP4_9GAMM|nr:hypothetical protein [Dyella mobilis]MBM7132386.1 hypothetical protein [Dyella mobilis]GLQ95626.1 hypothetical protein GCM10007863_00440 [Dyella mobilis]